MEYVAGRPIKSKVAGNELYASGFVAYNGQVPLVGALSQAKDRSNTFFLTAARLKKIQND